LTPALGKVCLHYAKIAGKGVVLQVALVIQRTRDDVLFFCRLTMAAMDIDPQTRSSFLGCVYNEKLPYADRIQGMDTQYVWLSASLQDLRL
jgi:hypothetical protein